MLTVGEIRKAIKGLPGDAPVFVNDEDGNELRVAGIAAYEGCNGEPAVSIELGEDEEDDCLSSDCSLANRCDCDSCDQDYD